LRSTSLQTSTWIVYTSKHLELIPRRKEAKKQDIRSKKGL